MNGTQYPRLAIWAVKLSLRVAQFTRPGVYPFVLIVNPDGSREVVAPNKSGKREFLGE